MDDTPSKKPLYYHKNYGNYGFGSFHPFDPERFSRFMEMIRGDEVTDSAVDIREAPAVDDDILTYVHSEGYLEHVKRCEMEGRRLSPDTPVRPGISEAARRIVGGSLEAAKSVERERITMNLGGLHHAGRDYGEGFCVFNDVAVAAEYLKRGGKKVCILDTDAHQGNGTMDIFWTSPKVLFISIHQHPATLYPGRGYAHEIGECDGLGYTVNIPLPRDANIADYHYAFREIILPVIVQFEPDVLIRNGGSDPHHSDSLTDLALDMRGLEYLGRTSREAAEMNGAGYIDLMVSGYGLRVLEGWISIMKGVLNLPIKTPTDQRIGEPGQEPNYSLRAEVEKLKGYLEPYWVL